MARFDDLKPNTNSYSPEMSTSAALSGGATFTSDWTLVSMHDSLTVAVATDVEGTLFVDFSPDGTNNDSSVPIPVDGTTPYPIQRLTVLRKWARIRYVNGSSAQGFMRLQVMLGDKQIINSPLHLAAPRTVDAIVTKSMNMERLIALGLVSGFISDTKFGQNIDIDTTTDPEDIWRGGGDYTGQPTGAAETVEVFSGDAADASAGTGMRTARLFGLDANGLLQTVDVTLNGTTPVTTTETWTRLYRVRGLTYGAGGTNAGQITVRHTTTTANVFAQVAAGTGSTEIAAFTVPANYTGIITRVSCGMARNQATGSAFVSLRTRADGSGGFNISRQYQISVGAGVDRRYTGGIPIAPLTDVKMRVEEVTANDSAVVSEIDYILVKV